MIIVKNAPCFINLNTHGGAVIDVGFAIISSCFGGWAVRLKAGIEQCPGLYNNIAQAYVKASQMHASRFILPQPMEQNDVVDQW